MVVAHTQPSTSTTSPLSTKKNRRKQSKKSTTQTAQNDTDQDMDDQGASTSNPITDAIPERLEGQDDDLMIDVDSTSLPQSSAAPVFAPLPANAAHTTLKSETRRIAIPPHRMTPLKKDWINIFGPLTEILGLQVRMNTQRRCVEARVRFLAPGYTGITDSPLI